MEYKCQNVKEVAQKIDEEDKQTVFGCETTYKFKQLIDAINESDNSADDKINDMCVLLHEIVDDIYYELEDTPCRRS